MSKSQTLRVLVNERLTAAAEEIFALFERTIAEYEEKLRRSERKTRGEQRLLNPRNLLPRAGAGIQALGPELNPENPEPAGIKEEPEEQSIKQEEEQLSVAVPDVCTVCVKTEESLLLQGQTEHRHETQEEDNNFHSETEGDTEHLPDSDDGKCERNLTCSDAQMETEDDGVHYNQVQMLDRRAAADNSGLSPEYKSAPETSLIVNNGDMARTDGAERKKYQCIVCMKRFASCPSLERHIRVHIGKSPYRCTVCEKTFNKKGNFMRHRTLHTGERPFSCSVCLKAFSDRSNFNRHKRTHTGEKLYSCSLCNKLFTQSTNLKYHMSSHTGDNPYSCLLCTKTFANKSNFDRHRRGHKGEKPYSCSLCNMTFSRNYNLKHHMSSSHKGENPYS